MLPNAILALLAPQVGGATPIPPPRPYHSIEPVLSTPTGAVAPGFLTITRVEFAGERLVLALSEDGLGADRNGDGDAFDDVWHVLDPRSGAAANLGLAAGDILGSGLLVHPSSAWALLSVEEADQGVDLNGDGDARDLVVFSVDPATATSRNSGLARGVLALDGRWALIGADELRHGTDLNGDGALGTVAYRWDLAGDAPPLATGLAIEPSLVAAHGGFALLGVRESAGGVDLNGDGDTLDDVLHAVELASGLVVDTGLAITNADPRRSLFLVQGSHAAFAVSEGAQRADLNGDGDMLDRVLHVFAGGAIENLGLAVGSPELVLPGHGGPQVRQPRLVVLADDAVAFLVSEAAQGASDLNGDGDTGDGVLFVHDLITGVTTNLQRSSWSFALADRRLAFLAREDGQGVDWDGDGDIAGFVVQVHDLDGGGAPWNTGLRSAGDLDYAFLGDAGLGASLPSIRGRWLAVPALETDEDLDGDGDTGDVVLVLADALAHRLVPTGLAVALDRSVRFQPDGRLCVAANEAATARDMNGDGDLADDVLHVLHPGLGSVIDVGATVAPLGLVDGPGRPIPFIEHEPDAGIDLDGDGAVEGLVLRLLRVKLR